jgi:replicative DNA helicase
VSNVHPLPAPEPEEDGLSDRRPPADLAAEQAVLSACIYHPAWIPMVAEVVDRADFYRPAHQLIWDVLQQQHRNDHPVTPIALHAEIERLGMLRQVDGGAYLFTISQIGSGDAEYFAEIVRDRARVRRADELTTRLRAAIQTGADGDRIDQLITDHQTHEKKRGGDSTGARFINGAQFILDIPDDTPAVWGEGDKVLWAEGEALLIAGPAGVGKTTVAQQVLLAAIGVRPHALGLAVRPAKRVLYLASDRPPQAARSLRRMVSPEHRELLSQHLVIWKGPPPRDFIKDPDMLLRLCQQADADMVCLDSLKDMAGELASEEGGQAINSAVQRTLVEGIEVVGLHHHRKRSGTDGGKEPSTLDELYGSTWITAGAGSVISLWGAAGDPIVNMRHLKQPAAECGPWRLKHDHAAGSTEIWHEVDVLNILTHARGVLTPSQLAGQIYSVDGGRKPSPSEIEKARRRLDALVASGQARKITAAGGRGHEAGYVAAFAAAPEAA